MHIQAVLSELAIERFNIGILCRLAWLNELQLDAVFFSPEKHSLAREFRAIVADNLFRQPYQRIHEAHHASA